MQEKKRKQKVAGECYFCGGTDLSKQHVFPAWASEYLQHDPGTNYRTFRRSVPVVQGDRLGLVVTDIDERERQGQLSQTTIRKYCQECNNGWMSRIENEAKSVALPLLKGNACHLREEEQYLLARWFTLMLIVAESGDPHSASLSREVVKKFYSDKQPLNFGRMFIGYLNGADWGCKMWHQGLAANSHHCNTQATTFGMGKLLVHLFSSELPSTNIDFRRSPYMQQIWPVEKRLIEWPLGQVIDDSIALRIANSLFETAMKGNDRKTLEFYNYRLSEVDVPKFVTQPVQLRRTYSHMQFSSELIEIDGNTYLDCVFTRCVLEFSSTGDVRFDRCQFTDSLPSINVSQSRTANSDLRTELLEIMCQAGEFEWDFVLAQDGKIIDRRSRPCATAVLLGSLAVGRDIGAAKKSGLAHLRAVWRLGGTLNINAKMRAIQSVLADAAGVMKCEARFHPDVTFGHFDLYAEPVETGEAFPLLRPEEAIAFFMRKVHRITALLPDVFLQVMEVSFEQFEESEADALSAALEKVGDIGVPSNASDLVLQFAAPPIALGIVDGVQLIRKVKWQQYQNTYIPPNNGPLSPFQSRQWALCIGIEVRTVHQHMLYDSNAQSLIWMEIQDEVECLLKDPTTRFLSGNS